MAYELINLREHLQTELQAEQDKAVATLQGEPPAKQKAQPVAPVAGPPAAPQPKATMPGPVPAAQAVPQQFPMADSFAWQTVRQSQAPLRQQVLRMQQQILQSQQQILHWHQQPIIPDQG
jgi:hypothetical protein